MLNNEGKGLNIKHYLKKIINDKRKLLHIGTVSRKSIMVSLSEQVNHYVWIGTLMCPGTLYTCYNVNRKERSLCFQHTIVNVIPMAI